MRSVKRSIPNYGVAVLAVCVQQEGRNVPSVKQGSRETEVLGSGHWVALDS